MVELRRLYIYDYNILIRRRDSGCIRFAAKSKCLNAEKEIKLKSHKICGGDVILS